MALLLTFMCIMYVVFFPYRYNMQDALSYSTRPLWDKPLGPHTILAHLHAPGEPADDEAACRRHSWEPRTQRHVLWDATLISTELDMMEIRLRELWNVVDKFIILESTHSMTGNPKVGIEVLLE